MELKDENEKLVQEIRANAEKEPQRPETQPEIPAQTPVLPEADESRDLPLHIEAMINEVEQEEDELNQKEQEASISYEEEALALYEKGLSGGNRKTAEKRENRNRAFLKISRKAQKRFLIVEKAYVILFLGVNYTRLTIYASGAVRFSRAVLHKMT